MSRVRLGLKGLFVERNKTKHVLVDLYYGVVHQLCGRIGEDNVQS